MSHPSRDWIDRANCAGHDLSLFFPGDDQRGRSARTLSRAAKQLCSTCPVAAECLQYALATEVKSGAHGVWGGTTAQQRQPLHDLVAGATA